MKTHSRPKGFKCPYHSEVTKQAEFFSFQKSHFGGGGKMDHMKSEVFQFPVEGGKTPPPPKSEGL